MAIPRVRLRQIKRSSGPTYIVDYTIKGKRYRRSVGREKRAAELIAAKLQTDLSLGHYDLVPTKQELVDLNRLIAEFLKSKENTIRDSSMRKYRTLLRTFSLYFAQYFPAVSSDISLIRVKYVKECFDHLLVHGAAGKKPWAKKTVNLLRRQVSAMFRYAVSQGYIPKNPVSETKEYSIPDKGGVKYFVDEDLARIWAVISPYWIDPLKFILHTGLRSGELVNLRWQNVNLKGDSPSIDVASSENWQTKSGKTRRIPLNSVALEIIERWQGRDSVYVFISRRGKQINQRRPLDAIQTALRKLGLEGDVHKLRHTFASRLVMKGVDLYTVKELLGHADLKSTQIYAHLSQEHLKSAVDKLE